MQAEISRRHLAEALGVSYQQIEKYEHGKDRIAASTLFQASRVLSVSMAAFFEGIEDDAGR